MPHTPAPPILYRFGLLAWIWRILMVLGILAAGLLLLLAVHFRDPWFATTAL